MLLRLLLLFTVLPLVELALLIELGRKTSVGTAIAVVLLTGLFGAAVARYEGLRTYAKIRSELAAGRLPSDQLTDAVLILLAGVLLITPGLITDCMGILLLIPPTRAMVRRYLKRRFRARFVIMNADRVADSRPGPHNDFVDVQARSKDDQR